MSFLIRFDILLCPNYSQFSSESIDLFSFSQFYCFTFAPVCHLYTFEAEEEQSHEHFKIVSLKSSRVSMLMLEA